MRAAVQTYAEEVSSNLHFLVTWPVVTPLRIGTIGTLDDSLFDPISDVGAFGIRGATDDGIAQADMVYTSNDVHAGAVDIGAAVPNLGGALPASASASVKFSFTRSYSVVLRASGVTVSRVADEIALGTAIADLFRRGVWNPKWLVVTQVLTGTSTSVFISGSSSSSISLSIAATANASGLGVLDASLSPSLTAQSNMDTVLLNANGAIPLFRAKRIKRSFWTGVSSELIAGASAETPQQRQTAVADLFDDIDSVDDL